MITIYGKPGCGWCRKALDLCFGNSLDYHYIDVSMRPKELAWLKEEGYTSVPQCFHEDTLIGGYEELKTFIERMKN